MTKNGRPSERLNQEMADIVCDLISISTKGLDRICRENPELPHESNIHRWRLCHESFREQYAQAKRTQAELLAQEIIAIADDGSNDTYVNDDGEECVNQDVLGRSRLRVDARKWVASKLLPKVYGDRQQDDANAAANTLIEKLLEKL